MLKDFQEPEAAANFAFTMMLFCNMVSMYADEVYEKNGICYKGSNRISLIDLREQIYG